MCVCGRREKDENGLYCKLCINILLCEMGGGSRWYTASNRHCVGHNIRIDKMDMVASVSIIIILVFFEAHATSQHKRQQQSHIYIFHRPYGIRCCPFMHFESHGIHFNVRTQNDGIIRHIFSHNKMYFNFSIATQAKNKQKKNLYDSRFTTRITTQI